MSIPTLCLNILIVLFTISPISIVQLILTASSNRQPTNNKTINYIIAIIYILLVGLISLLNIQLLQFNLPIDNYWYIIAIAMSLVVILFEYVLVTIILRCQGDTSSIIINNLGANTILSKLSIVLIGILEEIIYRQIWFTILLKSFGFNIIIVILLSAIFYAYNHIAIGKYIFYQKIISGCIYSLLYLLSGSIIIPIITHGLQNLIIVSRRK